MLRTQKQFLIATLLGLSSVSFAQITFQKTYGGSGDDAGSSIQQTSDGGYVIAGSTSSFGAGGSDVYLIKTNAAGDTVWTRTFGSAISAETGNSVQQTTDGGFIIAGSYFIGPGTGDVYVIRTNAAGDTLWTRRFGGVNDDFGYSVQQTIDSGLVIVGSTSSFGAGAGDVYLIKTNAGGNALWTRRIGGSSYEGGYSVQQTTDGGYVIAGRTDSFGAGLNEVYLIKTNADGDTLWTKTFGGNSYDEAWSVRQTRGGGYVIAGWTWSFGAGNSDVYLIKTNSTGIPVWAKTFGGSAHEFGYSAQQTSDSGYVIAGRNGFQDVCLIKTDAAGNTLWTRTFGGNDYDCGYSVQQTNDGGYVIAGVTRSFGAGQNDVYLIKTNANGVVSVPAEGRTPRSFALENNYPNPFNPTTNLEFRIPITEFVTLSVYNILGQEVRMLVNEKMDAGVHRVQFDAQGLPSGVYFYRLTTADATITKRMLLMR